MTETKKLRIFAIIGTAVVILIGTIMFILGTAKNSYASTTNTIQTSGSNVNIPLENQFISTGNVVSGGDEYLMPLYTVNVHAYYGSSSGIRATYTITAVLQILWREIPNEFTGFIWGGKWGVAVTQYGAGSVSVDWQGYYIQNPVGNYVQIPWTSFTTLSGKFKDLTSYPAPSILLYGGEVFAEQPSLSSVISNSGISGSNIYYEELHITNAITGKKGIFANLNGAKGQMLGVIMEGSGISNSSYATMNSVNTGALIMANNTSKQAGVLAVTITDKANGYYTQEELNASKQNSYNQGYNVGYTAGQASNTDLWGFIKNVAEVPTTFIQNMLNFEIFGINCADIVKALLTAIVIAVVMKWALGRG